MTEPYRIQTGWPIPETRGRKKGSSDGNAPSRQEAIAKGISLIECGHSCIEAARMVHDIYPGVTLERLVKLIRQARKDSDQRQSPKSNP